MGFTKLDEGILRSSVMAEPAETFKVFIALLASCDPDGIARISSVFLVSVCRLSEKVVDTALRRLEAPDKTSRSNENEGRRIKKIDGGYFVFNYEKYRAFSYSMKTEAARKRVYRKKGDAGHDRDIVPDRPGHSASASASSLFQDEEKSEEEKGPEEAAPRLSRAEVHRLWNEFADRHRTKTEDDSEGPHIVRPIIAINDGSERARILRARMDEPAFDFEKILAAAERQPFLFGANDRKWAISFDWLICPSNYIKVLELRYLDTTQGESEIDSWVKKSKGEKR